MRHIEIDSLSEEELIELNHKVVARLRFLSRGPRHSGLQDTRVKNRTPVASERGDVFGFMAGEFKVVGDIE